MHVRREVRLLLTCYVALLALLVATVAASFADLGHLSALVSVAISVAKAMLIALVFMDLRKEKPLLRVFATVGVLMVVVGLTLSLSDYLTR
jgi:cytochrome c oxidase subunit 4